jgi:hypothetical protein
MFPHFGGVIHSRRISKMKKLGLCLLSLCLVGYAVGCAKDEETPVVPPAGTGADADADTTEEGAETPATDAAN